MSLYSCIYIDLGLICRLSGLVFLVIYGIVTVIHKSSTGKGSAETTYKYYKYV